LKWYFDIRNQFDIRNEEILEILLKIKFLNTFTFINACFKCNKFQRILVARYKVRDSLSAGMLFLKILFCFLIKRVTFFKKSSNKVVLIRRHL